MSDLSQLIEIAKNIEKQNDEIIRLLKSIAGEKEESNRIIHFGELYLSDDPVDETKDEAESEEIENTLRIGSLLDNVLNVGEVYFIEEENIFKLSIKNNETIINNLTGVGQASEFKLQELIANESIKNNQSLDDGTVILAHEHSQKLPDTLKICVEQGAKKVYMPLSASAQLINAPQFLMSLLKFDFYRTEEGLIDKLFYL